MSGLRRTSIKDRAVAGCYEAAGTELICILSVRSGGRGLVVQYYDGKSILHAVEIMMWLQRMIPGSPGAAPLQKGMQR